MLQQNPDDRSVGELLADLTREIGNLVREEVNLAKSEMTQKATQVGKNIGSVAAGGVIAFAGFLAIQGAIIVALSKVLPLWAAFLVVGLVVMGVAIALIMKGLNALKQQDLAPHQTIETLKEDAQWAKQQMK